MKSKLKHASSSSLAPPIPDKGWESWLAVIDWNAAKPKSFPSRRGISPESILVESVDITSHEAEFVAPQLIQVIPWIDPSLMQVIKKNPETHPFHSRQSQQKTLGIYKSLVTIIIEIQGSKLPHPIVSYRFCRHDSYKTPPRYHLIQLQLTSALIKHIQIENDPRWIS